MILLFSKLEIKKKKQAFLAVVIGYHKPTSAIIIPQKKSKVNRLPKKSSLWVAKIQLYLIMQIYFCIN